MTAAPVAVLRYDEPARILDGRPLAARIRAGVKRQVAAFDRSYGFRPQLVAVMVGHQAASNVYVQQILRACAAVGVPSRVLELPRATTADQLRRRLQTLNRNPEVAGIIVQQPLPRHIPLSTLTDTIMPAKDIDGIHPLNTGLMTLGYEGFLPACAEAAVEIPKFYGYSLEGKRAVVIGRSNVVGGRIVGDVDFDSALKVAAAITPVPGGVGPVTNAVLLEHLIRAARWQQTDHPIIAGHARKRRAA